MAKSTSAVARNRELQDKVNAFAEAHENLALANSERGPDPQDANLNPPQWAEALSKNSGVAGDWWVDAVILGRLAKLADKYCQMRRCQRPFMAWNAYKNNKKHRRNELVQKTIALNVKSWRFR